MIDEYSSSSHAGNQLCRIRRTALHAAYTVPDIADGHQSQQGH
jgi:hypothetical protein